MRKGRRVGICNYCGKEIPLFKGIIVRGNLGFFFCNKVCKRRFREKTPSRRVTFERMLCCGVCGLYDSNGEYVEGNICPKCGLSNLIIGEGAVYERTSG